MGWKRMMTSLAAGALSLPAVAIAQDLSPELQALDEQLPGTLINDPSRIDWPVQGSNFESEAFADPSVRGGAARRFEIERASPDAWAVQALVPLLGGIKKGETVTVGFWARATGAETDDGKGLLGVRVQRNVDPWPGFLDTTVKLGPQWQWHEVSAVSTIDSSRRDAVLALQLGAARQTVEIGQTIVIKGAPSILGDMPATAIDLPEPLRAESGHLINRPDRRGWYHSGPAGSAAEREDRTIWLGKATRFTVTEKGANRWDVGTGIPLEEGIEPGDKLLIAIAARAETASTDDGTAVVGFRVQSTDPPHAGFADNQFKVGPKWQLIRVRTTTTEAIPAGKATIALHFAEAPQTVDIGPVYVIKLED